jgi:hypothetical protein
MVVVAHAYPSGHAVQFAAPDAEYEPSAQAVGALAPSVDTK